MTEKAEVTAIARVRYITACKPY